MELHETTGTAKASAQAALQDVLLVALAALVPFAHMLLGANGLYDGDTGWHVALGRWILEHGTVPHTDPFSFTAQGQPWTAHEWLAGVLMALAHQAAGWSGVLLLYGLALAALFAVLALYLRRWLPPLPSAAILALVAVSLALFAMARPHVLAWPLLAAWLVILLRAREEGRAPPLPAALLMVLWANIHGSFALGLALIGPFAAEAVLAAWKSHLWPTLRGWTLFGLAALIAALVTPYGIEGLLFPLRLVAMPALDSIAEWGASDFSHLGPFEAVLLIGLFACLLRPVAVPPWRLLVLVGMLHMAFSHVRHQALFAIMAALVLAMPLAASWGRNGGVQRFALRPAITGEARRLVLMVGVLMLAMAAVRAALPMARPDMPAVPASAVAGLPDGLRGRPVFNDYAFGGTLIEAGYPVFIDGRVDMYGPELLGEYLKAESGDPAVWQAVRTRYGIDWAILRPESGLAGLLEKEPGWRRIHADPQAVVFLAQENSTKR